MTTQESTFAFGENWSNYVKLVGPARIHTAKTSLLNMLAIEPWEGIRFLDVGCGSGVFSLAARQLGAHVYSFDADSASVACARALRHHYCPTETKTWRIEQGSVLDHAYLAALGTFDVVYAWGVLHHTGAMWQACENLIPNIKPEGRLFLALYNDQGWRSSYWKQVKRLYNRDAVLKTLITIGHLPLVGGRYIARLLSGRLKHRRGMSLWHDYVDWIGGYPYEVARPEAVIDLYRMHGFAVEKLNTDQRRSGCNEFVFIRNSK